MFRRFFRIGFGGCGCALEEHFRDHAAELSYDMLNDFYLEKLKNWTGELPSEPFDTFEVKRISDLIISPEKGKEEGNYASEFFEKLNKIIAELDSWKGSLDVAKGTGMSYEDAIIDVLIQNVTKMRDEAKSIKNRGDVLLESLPVDSAATSERHYVYNKNITETRELIVDHFGHAVIESSGFNHQPELQMLPLSIKEVRDEVYKKLVEYIGPKGKGLLHKAIWGDFFFVGLGGGTGTGMISPLAERFGKGSYGYFTLALLGGKQDKVKLESQQPWFRRCFNMLLALNDLIKTAELDGIILVDNNVIIDAIGKDLKGVALMEEIDKKLIKELYPAFGLTTLENKDMGLDWSQLKGPILSELKKRPPVIVPCYASGDGNLSDLIDTALESGKLAPYNNHKSAEKVFVYARWIKDEKALREKLENKFNEKKVAIIKEYLFCWDDLIDAKNMELELEKLKNFLKDICNIDWADNAKLVEAQKNEEGDESENKPKKLISRIFRKDKGVEEKNKPLDELVVFRNDDDHQEQWIKIQMEKYICDWDDVVINKFDDLNEYLKKGEIIVSDDYKPKISQDKKNISIEKDGNKAIIELDEKNKKATLYKEQYLFSWDNLPGEDNEKLIEFLNEEFNIDGANDAVITKSDDGMTIFISKGQKQAEIKRDDENNGVTFKKINGFEPLTLKIEEKNGNIYKKDKRDLIIKKVGVGDKIRRKIYQPMELKFSKKLIAATSGDKKLRKPELDVKKENGKHHVYLKGCADSRDWVLESVEKDIVVFESQEIGPFWHEEKKNNEVLILLVNPDVKGVLENRLHVAKTFVELLVAFKELIDKVAKEDESKDKLEIANKIITGKYDKNPEIISKLSDLLNSEVRDTNEKEILTEARNFLCPKELYEKNKAIYDDMAKIVDRLKKEVDKIGKKGWWPIFEEKIFDSISLSGEHDEVLISAISAFEGDIKDKFGNLVGDAYNKYFKTYQRQFFKYNSRYLYSSGVNAEDILSDDAEKELPEELKDKIREQPGEIEEETLKEWVEEDRNKPVLLFTIGSGKRDLEAWKEEFSEKAEITLNNPQEIKNGDELTAIKDGEKTYVIKEEGTNINVYRSSALSFPAMLVIAGLYVDWQGLFRRRADIASNGGSDESGKESKTYLDFENDEEINVGKLKKALFKNSNPDDIDFKICTSDEVQSNGSPNLLIIDKDNEDAALIIRRAAKDLFAWKAKAGEGEGSDDAKKDLNNKRIPNGLKEMFKREREEVTDKNYNPIRINDSRWELQKKEEEIKSSTDYVRYYIDYETINDDFKISSDESHKLRVKAAAENKEKTLKIYKKRGEKFEAATQ